MGTWYTWVLAIVLGVGLGILMNKNKKANPESMHLLNKEDFFNNMRKGQLIDIRKKDVFEAGSIKGARNFKPSSLTGKYSKLRKDQSVYLYCQNGKKSKRIAKKLSSDGFKTIYILDGGYDNNKDGK